VIGVGLRNRMRSQRTKPIFTPARRTRATLAAAARATTDPQLRADWVVPILRSARNSADRRQPRHDLLGDLFGELDRVPIRHDLHLCYTQRGVPGHVGKEPVDVGQRGSGN
jgi:hypothetical protein